MSDALNETVIRIVDDPDQENGVIVRSNLPDPGRADSSTLTPAQRAGALIMRNVRSMIEVAQAGPVNPRSVTQATQRQLTKQLGRKRQGRKR
jgi:hypothetical protein